MPQNASGMRETSKISVGLGSILAISQYGNGTIPSSSRFQLNDNINISCVFETKSRIIEKLKYPNRTINPQVFIKTAINNIEH